MTRIPRQTRILLIPDDQRPTREYHIGRGMVIGLAIGLAALLLLVAAVLASFGYLGQRVRRAESGLVELEEARRRVAQVALLERELERARMLQESLLTMLGVGPADDPAAEDSLARAVNHAAPRDEGRVLAAAAELVMTPAPDSWPAAGHVTREFQEGDRPAGILPHRAIDIAGPLDSDIRAAGAGLVRKARWDDTLGNFVEIQHGFGYVTVYGHCNRLVVREGERVQRQQLLGYLGGTGRSSAPHLHFEIWQNGEAVDPRSIVPGDPPR